MFRSLASSVVALKELETGDYMWKVGGVGAKTSNIKNTCFRIQNKESSEIKLLKRSLNLNAGAKKEVAWGEVVSEEVQNRLPTPLPPLSSRR